MRTVVLVATDHAVARYLLVYPRATDADVLEAARAGLPVTFRIAQDLVYTQIYQPGDERPSDLYVLSWDGLGVFILRYSYGSATREVWVVVTWLRLRSSSILQARELLQRGDQCSDWTSTRPA